MLRIDQPSTIAMGIVAFVTVDSQSSSDHRQIGYRWLADQSTDLPTTMKPLNRAAGGMGTVAPAVSEP